MSIWARSWNCGCLVAWFCYQFIAKPGNKTAAVPWPDPYEIHLYRLKSCSRVVVLISCLKEIATAYQWMCDCHKWTIFLSRSCLTHLPLAPHIYASVNWVCIGSDNGLSPVRRQAITWTNTDLLSIGALGTNLNEIRIKIQNFSFMKMHLKLSSAKPAAILSRGRWVKPALTPLYCTFNTDNTKQSPLLHCTRSQLALKRSTDLPLNCQTSHFDFDQIIGEIKSFLGAWAFQPVAAGESWLCTQWPCMIRSWPARQNGCDSSIYLD